MSRDDLPPSDDSGGTPDDSVPIADSTVRVETAAEKSPTQDLRERIDTLAEQTGARSRYVLKGEVGRGGMGAVLKVFDTGLRRNLAMKVLLGKASAETGRTTENESQKLARFLEEAQVTGQLDHPGVVPVHELGVDSQGRVYFTMRLVRGRDLRHIFELVYEGKEGWTVTRALGVLLKVCEAMAYAHDKGVVHRDLKPANVMVGRYGEVYVMDWGLARVEGQAETRDMRLQASVEVSRSAVLTERTDAKERDPDSPLLTMDGTVVGTPFYMPPEQALGQVEKIGPRSDVYAVGSMLYHLVSGRMPYYVEGSRPSPYAVLAMVAHAPPQPLRELAPEVPAELIAICEKAMARDPERRYADMGELREDLSAYIEHRVVHAYQTGAVAEFKKWVERNLGLAASIAAAIGLVSAALVWGTVSATREANRAQKEADAAQRARGFVVELYQAFDPFADTRAVLESKVDELLKQLDDLPAEKADSLEVIASLWHRFHLNRQATESLRQALVIRQDLLPEDSEKLARVHTSLGRILHESGSYRPSAEHLRQALEIRREIPDADVSVAIIQGALAAALWKQGDYATPQRLFAPSLDRLRAEKSSEVDRCRIMLDFAGYLEEQGRVSQAEGVLREALGIKVSDSAGVGLAAQAWHRLGMLLWHTPRFGDAEKCVRRAIADLHKNSAQKDPIFAFCMVDLALFHDNRGHRRLAASISRKFLSMIEELFGEDSMAYAEVCEMASLRLRSGQTQESLIYAKNTLRLYEEMLGEEHPRLADPLTILGSALSWSLPADQRLAHLERAWGLRRQVDPDSERWRTADTAGVLGAVLVELERYAEAEPHLVGSLQVLQRTHGAKHPLVGTALQRLVDLYQAWGDADEAAVYQGRIDAENRKWPFFRAFRDHDWTAEDYTTISYDDAYLEKTIELAEDPLDAAYARLWIYGETFNWPGEHLRARMGHHVEVNGMRTQVISFDVSLTFDYHADKRTNEEPGGDSPRWVPIEIPVDWLVRGPNRFLFYGGPHRDLPYEKVGYLDHEDPPFLWTFNNLAVGVDHGATGNNSWRVKGRPPGNSDAEEKRLRDRVAMARQDREVAASDFEGELMIFLELSD